MAAAVARDAPARERATRRAFDVATSNLVSLSRGFCGGAVGRLGPRPEKPLELYEFEGCPFCRKVREALSILDLDALVYPCPKGGARYRQELRRRGGKELFPYLADPNTGEEMYESGDIVSYLFQRYGDGPPPLLLRLGPLTDLNSILANTWRIGRGTFYRKARAPEYPLELYGYEASPDGRLVRERLCSLELPYRLHNIARGSRGREAFVQRSGKMMMPYLIDANTGAALFQSAEIAAYLEETYAERP